MQWPNVLGVPQVFLDVLHFAAPPYDPPNFHRNEVFMHAPLGEASCFELLQGSCSSQLLQCICTTLIGSEGVHTVCNCQLALLGTGNQFKAPASSREKLSDG